MRSSGSHISEKISKQKWTVGDLIVGCLVITFGLYLLFLTRPSSAEVREALILKNGKQIATVSLNEEKLINLSEFGVNMVLEIKDSRIKVLSSDCKKQICVHQGWISHAGEAVFCLPNHITVELTGDTYDAISR